MISRMTLAVLTALLVLASAEAFAKDEACVDGVNCFCDKVKTPGDSAYDPNNVFCEDFELPALDQNGGSGWTDRYGAPVDGCWQKGMPTGQWVTSVEGTCPTCCLNVVKEGACEVSGQGDCVFQGSQSFGHRYRPNQTGGVVGGKQFSRGANFGVTMAVKYSRNFVNAAAPKKTNEFGGVNNCILGCSSGTYASLTAALPFHGVIFWQNGAAAPRWTNVVGRGGFSGVAFGWYPNVPGDYDFNRDHGVDSWHCWKLHISNVGGSNATVRHWIDDKLLVHVTGVDLSGMTNASTGLDSIAFNNYYNESYPGSSIAYRYEDNIAVTTGPEPTACRALGFTSFADGGSGGSTGGGTGSLGIPGQPTVVP